MLIVRIKLWILHILGWAGNYFPKRDSHIFEGPLLSPAERGKVYHICIPVRSSCPYFYGLNTLPWYGPTVRGVYMYLYVVEFYVVVDHTH